MERQIDLNTIHSIIQSMKNAAEELKSKSERFPALTKNLDRILANIKMLEINVSDIFDLEF
jgi:hypothetical protein